ncbi:peptidoglycan-binding domain-containing protein [Nannocystis pusilla]|uniref:peptidoglycan-binding domain-containing protein n=1 Tax=Nannocystis pusilla TaxID=889268 RepID=UPI003B7CD6E9
MAGRWRVTGSRRGVRREHRGAPGRRLAGGLGPPEQRGAARAGARPERAAAGRRAVRAGAGGPVGGAGDRRLAQVQAGARGRGGAAALRRGRRTGGWRFVQVLCDRYGRTCPRGQDRRRRPAGRGDRQRRDGGGGRVPRAQVDVPAAPRAPRPGGRGVGAQARLGQLGFYHGRVSGELDDATALALWGLQLREGLPATGELDAATQAKLRELYGM